MPVHNDEIAGIFEEIADLLELEQANPFRVRAYRNAARSVRALGRELGELVEAGEDLTRLPGIGKDLAAKIREIIATGSAQALEELHRRVPAGLEDLLALPGLGPARVRKLHESLGLSTLAELEAAARAGKVRAVEGFGEKTERKLLDAIASRLAHERRFLRSVAASHAEALAADLRRAPGVREVAIAGSYRRGRETVGDIDILVASDAPARAMERFTAYDEVAAVISRGDTRSTVRLRCGLQVDLRVVAPRSYGAALQYFTGSKAHNIAVRRRGQAAGLKINEYGVFRGRRRVAGRTEKSVYAAVGLALIPPELREDRGEIEAGGELPVLVERDDLAGDLHLHTDASDGRAGIEAMARAARAQGLRYIAITDHSRAVAVANGLDEKRLRAQIETIDGINSRLKAMTVLKGIEVDILEDGSLDLPARVLRELDLVVGAVHSRFGLSRERQTERILRAMDGPYFTILAHPSGRLLGEREPFDVDLERIIEAAAERGCFLELNSQPRRLDLPDIWARAARDAGVLIAVDSDSHGPEGFDNLRHGIVQARRAWLRRRDVLNTRPLRELRRLIAPTMQR